MFTGLVQQVGTLGATMPRSSGARLLIRHAAWATPLVLGESVAVQGACLTVTAATAGEFSCDVLDETLKRTVLGSAKVGCRVNLERALRADERLGGHIVTGHIDGLGQVKALRQAGADWILEVACADELISGIVPKGSIAINGVSLTVASLGESSFSVHLIPHTLSVTALSELRAGMSVNLETDLLGKYVQRYLQTVQPGQGVTLEKLRKAGFGC